MATTSCHLDATPPQGQATAAKVPLFSAAFTSSKRSEIDVPPVPVRLVVSQVVDPLHDVVEDEV
jgi:hypothetical protein